MNAHGAPELRPGHDLDIHLDLGASPVRVRLTGELDSSTAAEVGELLDRLRGRGHRLIIIDVAGLRFLGTAGLREFVRTALALQEPGGRLSLTNLSPWLRRMLSVTGLDEMLVEPQTRPSPAPAGTLTWEAVEPGHAVIVVRGVIDDDLLADLGRHIATMAVQGVCDVELDLSEVTSCDRELVPALADACRVLTERNGSLRTVAATGCVREALDAATPTDLFALYLAAAVPAQRQRHPSATTGSTRP